MTNTADRALIFDMDGVLIDSEPLWRRAEIEVFARVGLSLTEDDCYHTQGLRIDEAVAYWFARAPWTGPACEHVADEIVARMVDLIRNEGKPLPGVQSSVEAATDRGWRLGLASSSSTLLIETVLARLGLQSAFECTHSAEAEARGKPAPDVYLSTAATLGIDPARCVAIEDSVNGVASAHAAGMRCIAVPAPEMRGSMRFPDVACELESLEDLPQALERLGQV